MIVFAQECDAIYMNDQTHNIKRQPVFMALN